MKNGREMLMDLGLENKSVIILAASKGLRKATAFEIAKEGANVVIGSRKEEELEKTTGFIRRETDNPNVYSQVCDITKAEDIKSLVKFAAEKHGTVDVLINNAGGPPAGRSEER